MSWQRNAMLVGNNAALEACWVGAGCGAVHWEQYYASDALRMYIYIYTHIFLIIIVVIVSVVVIIVIVGFVFLKCFLNNKIHTCIYIYRDVFTS